MDDESLRNWGYYEPPIKGHLGLQLMSSPFMERDVKPYLSGRDNPIMVSPNGAHHPRDCTVTDPPVTQIDYVRDSWMNHRDKFLHMFPGNPYESVLLSEPSGSAHPMQMVQQQQQQQHHDVSNEAGLSVEEESLGKKETGPGKKKRAASGAAPRPKKAKKAPAAPKESGAPSGQRAKMSKKSVEVVINGVDMDITGIPIPVCTCTGTPQQCYRWGCGGWQSACCTTTVSMYPLPMSTKRRGARIAGRKMSQGAFKKVLEKLASEGYDFGAPIDLKGYWAKHGTNKFVVIR